MSATKFRHPPLRLVTLEVRDVPAGGTVIPFAYVDGNLNGRYDSFMHAGEQAIVGVPVYADLNVNGQLDPGEPSGVTRSARFDFDTDGTYLIRATPLPGQRPTTPLAVAVAVSGGGFFGPQFGFAVSTNAFGSEELLAVGAGPGGAPQVQVFNGDGSPRASFFAYDLAFRGGVHVTTADVTGDGTEDVITAPGAGGGPHVRVFDGRTFRLVSEWMAYDPAFTGGVNVAVLADRSQFQPASAEVVTAPGPGGGPHVRVFGADGTPRLEFFAYAPAFRGGVNVAAGPTGTGEESDIVTGAGPGGGPHVQVFSRNGGQLLQSFYAYDAGFTGGVTVAVADVLGDGRREIVTAPGAGGVPLVNVFDTRTGQLARAFLAFDPGFRGGMTVAGTAILGDSHESIALGPGPGGLPYVRVVDAERLADQETMMAFDPTFTGGVFVG